jgi:hypothetical protein
MSTVLTSIHGKRLGIDSDGYLTGDINGIKVPTVFQGASGSEFDNDLITSATISSTGTAISNSGVTLLTATAAKAYTISDPTHVRQRKVISQTSSSTAAKTVTTVGGAGIGFDGLNHIATFLGRGEALHLQATSTAMWAVIAKTGSVTLTTA